MLRQRFATSYSNLMRTLVEWKRFGVEGAHTLSLHHSMTLRIVKDKSEGQYEGNSRCFFPSFPGPSRFSGHWEMRTI